MEIIIQIPPVNATTLKIPGDNSTCLIQTMTAANAWKRWHHFVKIRFAKGEYCPHCNHNEIYRFSNGKRFRCSKCKQDFTIRTNTVFGESKIPLRKWFIAIYLLTSNRKGISSVELAEKVGVTQKAGWFIDHRLRESMKQNGGQLFGRLEADETWMGGRVDNMSKSKRKPNQRTC